MKMRCPSCGTTYAPEAKFCTQDGTRLVAAAAASAPGATGHAGEGSGRASPPRTTDARPGAATPAHQAAMNHSNLTGQVLDGRYKVVKKIGEGGMSFVYLASDVSTNERFAIKILSPSLSQDPNAMARLRREAGLGIRLAHPNVCHIMRLGETEDGFVYVVMPFVEGEILSDRTNRMKQIPLAQAVKFTREIAAGLQVAHELRIIHRDLKPENVMICGGDDDNAYAVVMDFGLAKERKAGTELEKLTATGIILGTPEFMSPEQLRGKQLDGRTDIYSLSLLTYEMITGKLPFTGRNQQELMIARLRSEPIPIRQARPDLDLPAEVEKVLLKAMHRDPDSRYQTAPEFATALDRASREGNGGGLLGRILGR
jgi:eukaryotic-like serine/threonine-protein kinase